MVVETQKRKIVLIHESIAHSLAKDTATFGLMGFVLWLNFVLLNNNKVTSFMIITLLLISAIMRATRYIDNTEELHNKEQAQRFIDQYYE